MESDERISWVREKSGRKIIQIIEPMPIGFSVTTQWMDGDKLERQDCEVSIRDVTSDGKAKEM